ncbi:SPASM domain-containing protein [Caloranaerobacter sp. DY30410]|uniref:SPASM domain-containing protein n=1 Tax=Caloranaerobacter sp. DY30410 TaxID=3238305 RepID=UPI003D08ED3B
MLDISDYYPKLLRAKYNDNRIKDFMIDGSEVNILSKVYKYWKLGKPVAPNFRGCDAVYPGRYCFYPDGKIYPCTDIVGIDEYAIGVYKPRLSFNDINEKWKNFSINDIDKCNQCKYIGMCNGGCLVTNKCINGDITVVECIDIEKALEKFIIELYRERFLLEDEKIFKWHSRNVFTMENCKQCKYKYICSEGCSYKAIEKHGNWLMGNCADFQRIFSCYLKYYFLNRS